MQAACKLLVKRSVTHILLHDNGEYIAVNECKYEPKFHGRFHI